MARIRSIKPEFWIDEKVVELSSWARLLFIGLWSFADDQGYVDDKPRRIKMQVFPNDDLDIEVLLDELFARGMLDPFTSPVGPVFRIRNWTRHQKVDRAAAPRFDEASLISRERSTSPREPSPASVETPQNGHSTSPREDSLASVDAEGKGSGRDLEGKGSIPPSAGALTLAPRLALPDTSTQQDPPDTAQALIAEWIDHCRKRPPGTVIGQVGKQIKAMLAEGIDPVDIRVGLAEWWRKGIHPSALPSVVNELMNAGPARASPGRPANDIDWEAAMRRAEAREATT